MAVHGRRRCQCVWNLSFGRTFCTWCGDGFGGNAPRISAPTDSRTIPARHDDQKDAGHRPALRFRAASLGSARPAGCASLRRHDTQQPRFKRSSRSPSRLAGRSVVLVGLMGAGKTSIGRRLAARLGLPFRDADAEIELAAGCTIPELFSRYGEQEFRDGERRVIRRLLAGDPIVLATGGGSFMAPETRAGGARAKRCRSGCAASCRLCCAGSPGATTGRCWPTATRPRS